MAEKYLNKKQELFCKFMAEGCFQAEAYELAGYEPSSANASTLANKPQVKKRIEELKAEADRRNAEFKVLAHQAEQANPELAKAVTAGLEWNFQRVMDMMADNVRLAQISSEFGAANACLKMMGEGIKMFSDAKVKQQQQEKLPNSLAFIQNLTQMMGESSGVPIEEEAEPEPVANPLSPRRGRKAAGK